MVLRVAHREDVSPAHTALRDEMGSMGDPLASLFVRLTPGRGARPEVLFNLDRSGPPALFFVYHVYPVLDLFGKVDWVESGAEYVGLQESGGYDRFLNTLTVGFRHGGIGRWTWAGGIEIDGAEEYQRILISLDGGDAEGFARVTGENVGGKLAVLVDDEALTVPRIMGRIEEGKIFVRALISREDALDLAACLRAGPLPLPLEIAEITAR